MNFATAMPSITLAPHIKQYWALESCVDPAGTYSQRIVPSGFTELMFYSGTLPSVSDAKRAFASPLTISGQQNSYYDLHISGKMSVFSIVLKPHALMMFFDVPASEFADRTVCLTEIARDDAARLSDKLQGSTDFDDKVAAAEAFLINRLHQNKKRFASERISHSMQHIAARCGIINVESLAETACLSRRQFDRTFTETIGIRPKAYLRAIRFQYAIYQKSCNPGESLTSIAYASGYYDQAHMTNEFRQLSGLSPKQYFKDCEIHSDFFG